MSIASTFIFALGLIGNLAFAYACVPTAYRTWRAGQSIGTPVGLAWNIFGACIAFYSYMILAHGFDALVIGTGMIETAAYGVVLWFHYRPRKK